MNVFIHSGTQEIQFSRLLSIGADYAWHFPHAHVTYQGLLIEISAIVLGPKIYVCQISRSESFSSAIKEADIVICHAGTGHI